MSTKQIKLLVAALASALWPSLMFSSTYSTSSDSFVAAFIISTPTPTRANRAMSRQTQTHTHTHTQTGDKLDGHACRAPSSFSTIRLSMSGTALDEAMAAKPQPKSIVVISPPGGAGEAAAVQAAAAGHKVNWFLVRDDDESVSIPQSVAAAWKGSLSLAGGRVMDIIADDGGSASRAAISAWAKSAGAVDVVIASYDWEDVSQDSTRRMYKKKAASDSDIKLDLIQANLESAIRVAVKETMDALGPSPSVVKLTLLPENVEIEDDAEELDGDSGGPGALLGSLFGAKEASVPSTLAQAFGSSNVKTLRFGDLFGLPMSSPEFSPLVGGPKREATLATELLQQGIRVDPFVPGSRKSDSICSRPTVGLAAVLWATGALDGGSPSSFSSVLVASQSDLSPQPLEAWQDEWKRAQVDAQKVATSSPIVFEQLNLRVKNPVRLADWLATKWAPAVMRTYDLASIRSGARPVYAQKDPEDDTAAILVWQQLAKDMTTETVAKMRLSVSSEGVVAMRESKTRKPLPGEAVLVRRLQEALVQAVDKGLATRVKKPKQKKQPEPVAVAAAPSVVSTVQESGSVVSADGPRTAGARRSTQRKRRSTRKAQEDNQ